jgi:hypothetical protein
VVRGKRVIGRVLVAAIAVASVWLTLAASPPGAAAKRDHGTGARPGTAPTNLFGTTIWEPPTTEEYQRMAAGGISHMKLLISASLVAPDPSTRDWRLYDQMVADAARAGIGMDPWFFGVPGWMSANPATFPIWTPAQASFWSSFVGDAARRYGPGGQFWAQNPNIPARPMRNWEVWNEPNITEFTGTTATRAGDYARLLAITRAALKRADPANRVVLGGLYRRPKAGHGIRMSRYLELLYKGKRRSLFDAVAIHPYASKPRQVLSVTQSVRRVMNAHGDRRKPLWITELGWATGGDYWSQSLYRATLEQQATRVGRTTALLLANRRRLRLQRIDWHTWRDLGGTGLFWDKHMGLFTADGEPKPAWSAFTGVTGGVAGGPIRNVGHFVPWGLVPPPGGGVTQPPPPPPAPPPDDGPHCILIIFCA